MSFSDIQNVKPTGIILAGGKSSRMGQEKAQLKLGNKSFIEIILQTITPLCSEILISTNNPALHLRGTKSIADEIQNIGPLGGIYTCLNLSKSFKNIIVTVDTPLISTDLLKYLLNQSENHEVTYCEHNNKEHPLIGIYTKKFLRIIEEDIQNKKYKTLAAIRKSNFRKLKINKNHQYYKEGLFKNINNPVDLLNLQENYRLK